MTFPLWLIWLKLRTWCCWWLTDRSGEYSLHSALLLFLRPLLLHLLTFSGLPLSSSSFYQFIYLSTSLFIYQLIYLYITQFIFCQLVPLLAFGLTLIFCFSFEMETFEFINILQCSGFPRVIGVLSHLDSFVDSKALKRKKKTFKQRFWSEIYDGAKLFYLSGLQYGRYPKTEVRTEQRGKKETFM